VTLSSFAFALVPVSFPHPRTKGRTANLRVRVQSPRANAVSPDPADNHHAKR